MNRTRKLKALGVAALAGAAMMLEPCKGSAQEPTPEQRINPSILEFAPLRGSVDANSTAKPDTLRVSDPLVRAGRRVAAWSLQTQESTSYEVSLSSADFDAFLYIVGPGIVVIAEEYATNEYALTDDDSGDGLNSWLCFDAPQEAEYRVIASALYGETGAYSLEVREVEGCLTTEMDVGLAASPGPAEEMDVIDRPSVNLWEDVATGDTIEMGVVHRGTFSRETMSDEEGRPVVGWILPAEKGRRIGIGMVADGFNPLLHVLSANDFRGGFGLGRDVAYGHITDNELLCILVPDGPSDGIYRVIASAETRVEGVVSYGLMVMEDPDELLCPTVRTSAEYYREMMMGLPTDEARAITIGEVVEGVLTENEHRDAVRGIPVQTWFLRDVAAGDSVVIEMRSGDFWPDLAIRADTGAIESEEDECYAIRRFVLPEQEDDYRMFVRTQRDSPEATGAFTLMVGGGETWNEPVLSCDAMRVMEWEPGGDEELLRVGYEVQGQLPWGDAEAVWRLELMGEEGAVVLAVESEDFDTYLEVYGPNVEERDDDSGVSNTSRLVLEDLQAGTYYVVVSSFGGEGGVYRLRATVGGS